MKLKINNDARQRLVYFILMGHGFLFILIGFHLRVREHKSVICVMEALYAL